MEKCTIYFHDGKVTIELPRGVYPDEATIHAICELMRAEKEKASAGGQTDEGQPLN